MFLEYISHPSLLHQLFPLIVRGYPGVIQFNLDEFYLRALIYITVCIVGNERGTHFSNQCFSCSYLESRASLGTSCPVKCGLRRLCSDCVCFSLCS